MPNKVITFDAGLNKARHPVMLGEGELSEAEGVEYRPGSPSAYVVDGHTVFGPSAGYLPPFMLFAQFAANKPLLLIGGRANDGTYGSTVGFTSYPADRLTVGFADAVSVTGVQCYEQVNQVDAVNYANEYYILFGGNLNRAEPRNFVFRAGASTRYMGMLPNKVPPSVNLNGGENAGFVLTAGKSITYWVEERVKDGATIKRRNVGSSLTTVRMVSTGGTIKPVVTRPTTVNSDATHWALFGTGTNVLYPTGFEIAEVPIDRTYVEDTRTGTDPGAPGGTAYATLSAIVQGLSLTVPKYGTAPYATIGDTFEDRMVCDDPALPGILRFSLTGDMDHFPAFNGIRIPSRDGSIITMIRAIGQAVLVGTQSSLWRVVTLPDPTDAGFNIERIKERLDGALGAISQKASCLFTTTEGVRLAYVSSAGIHVTNGAGILDISGELDWPNTVATAQLDSCFLVNNTAKSRIEFYYASAGSLSKIIGTTPKVTLPAPPNRVLYFHYHHTQIKQNGMYKVTGPHSVNASSGTEVIRGTEKEIFLNTYNATSDIVKTVRTGIGASYFEGDTEVTIPVALTSAEFYPAGIDQEATITTASLHHTAGANDQEAGITTTARAEDRADIVVLDSVPVETDGLSSVSTRPGAHGTSFKFKITKNDSLGSFGVNFISAEFTPQGEPASGYAKTIK